MGSGDDTVLDVDHHQGGVGSVCECGHEIASWTLGNGTPTR
jgi:hypothetical protein